MPLNMLNGTKLKALGSSWVLDTICHCEVVFDSRKCKIYYKKTNTRCFLT